MSIDPTMLKNVDSSIIREIRSASAAGNVDFGLMMAEAAQESGFRPDAKASTSSATGLYQFTDGTWLGMIRKHGAELGLGDLAAQVECGPYGTKVNDPALRQKILDLRTDPRCAALMAAAFTRDNKADIEKATGRQASSTDLYLAHFLGSGGARTMLAAHPETDAAALFPGAAAANGNMFYDRATGKSRSVAELYAKLQDKIEPAAAAFAAAAGVARETAPAASQPATTTTADKPTDILASVRALKAAAASMMMMELNKQQNWELSSSASNDSF